MQIMKIHISFAIIAVVVGIVSSVCVQACELGITERSLTESTEWKTSCGTSSPPHKEKARIASALASWKTKHHGRDLFATNITIPVTFQIIQKDSIIGTLPQEAIDIMMTSLNHGYSQTPFSFQYAETIHVIGGEHRYVPSWFDSSANC
jgi:hypothetical protein